ncbi:hypothetical protein U1Q18_048079 [Sarracenia purpurea var. burkii]
MMQYLKNIRSVFLNGIESLQSRASTELAFNLWQHKYFSLPASQRCDASFLNINFSCTEILTKSVPPCIKEMIDAKIEQIRCQLPEWINFLTKATLFDQNFLDVLPKCFHSIVFNSNGTICFRQTASNMVKMAEFSDLEKYKIACTFCLENDVRLIWPLVSKDSRVNGNDSESDQFDLMNYWNMRMKSEMDSVTVGQRFRKSYDTQNWSALEYFFDMLTDEDLLQNISVFHGRGRSNWRKNFEFMGNTLCKFNKDQARMLFQRRPGRLLASLIAKDEYFSHACKLWSIMKQYVFESRDVFPNILRGMWRVMFEVGDLNFMRRDRVNQFLIEMWATAPDHVKSQLTENRIHFFFDNLYEYSLHFSLRYGHDMTFLLQLLNFTTYEIRNRMWKWKWPMLIPISKPLYLEEFIRLCLSNEEAIVFKQDASKTECDQHFKDLIKLALYSEFSDYLHFLLEDPKSIQDFSKQVLESNAATLFSYDDDKFCKFDAFVSSIYSNVAEDVDIFKEQIISSKEGLSHLHHAFNKDCLEDFNHILSKFIKSDQSLGKIKRELLDYCRDYIPNVTHNPFDRNKWTKLLEWCTADAQEISAFKTSLNIDGIFEKQIANYRGGYPYDRKCLSVIDEFAIWYFDDEPTRKKFKMSKIINYKNSPAICAIFATNTDSNLIIIRLLKWFFDADLRMVHEFQQYSGISKISSLEIDD